MKCDAMREWFSDRLDDSLDPDRSAQVDQHLAQCASCLAEFEALRLAIGRLRQAGSRGEARVRCPAGRAGRSPAPRRSKARY